LTLSIKSSLRRYLGSTWASAIFDSLRQLIVANLLTPYQSGLCASFMSIPQIALYLNMGLVMAPSVLVPQYQSSGNEYKVQRFKNSILSFTCFSTLFLFLALCLYAAFLHKIPYFLVYSIAAGILIFATQIYLFFLSNYSAALNFTALSWVEFCFAGLSFVLQIAAVYFWQGYGFWLGSILAHLFILIYTGRNYFKNNRYQAVFDSELIKKATPTGISLLISSVGYLPFIIIAKIFIAMTLGAIDVGYFFLSIIVISKIALAPKAVAGVILPRMASLQSTRANSKETFALFYKAQLLSFAITIIIVCAGWFLLEPVVRFILPNYIQGIPAAKIILLAGLPYSLTDNASRFLIASKLIKKFIFIIIFTLVTQIAVSAYLYHVGYTITSLSKFFIWLFSCYALMLNLAVFIESRQNKP